MKKALRAATLSGKGHAARGPHFGHVCFI